MALHDDFVKTIAKLSIHDHPCLIYDTLEERLSALLDFMKAGLDLNEKCVYTIGESPEDEIIAGLKTAGVDVETAIESGKLIFQSERASYLRQERFDPDRLIESLKVAVDEAKAAGFSALRVAGGMTTALCGFPGTERLMEYEAKLNYVFPEKEVVSMCLYNRKGCSPELLRNVLSTHPLVISGNVVVNNFYYVPPRDFFGEKQPDREIERLLAAVRATVEELQAKQKRLEELAGIRREMDSLILLNEQLEQRVRERTGDLKRKNYELEQMMTAFIGRELRMAELKVKIKTMEKRNAESGKRSKSESGKT